MAVNSEALTTFVDSLGWNANGSPYKVGKDFAQVVVALYKAAYPYTFSGGKVGPPPHIPEAAMRWFQWTLLVAGEAGVAARVE